MDNIRIVQNKNEILKRLYKKNQRKQNFRMRFSVDFHLMKLPEHCHLYFEIYLENVRYFFIKLKCY